MSDTVDALKGLTERMAELQQQQRERGQSGRHARMRAELLARMAEPASATPRLRWWAWSGAIGAVAAVVLLAWLALRPGPLTFEVESSAASGQAQAFLTAREDQPLRLTFSDGSAVELRPRARVRVAALRDDGAELVLESGAIEARIEPAASSSWRVVAGPYRVDVVGTALTVRWTPEDEAFELELHEGRAQVQGPRIAGTRAVEAGEHLVIRGAGEQASATVVAELEATTVDAGAQQPAEPAVTPSGSRSSARRGRRAAGSRAEATPDEAAADWRALARGGSYRAAIEAAEATGFSSLCAALDAEGLLELADAGRYARRSARAREALQALRRRFAGSEPAAVAAFDLGRLSTGASGCEEAQRWFRTYLRERPQGSLAEAARRRIDECKSPPDEEVEATP